MALALELEHNVDQVLEDTRPGDRAVLGHMADQDRGHASVLGHADERGGDLADLGDPAGRAVGVGPGHGLYGVEYQQRGLDLLDLTQDRREIGLGGEEQAVGQRRRPLGPQAHLGGRLLAGDVEGASGRDGPAGGDLEQQRRLADAWLAGEQDDRALDEAAAEGAVELVDARRPGSCGLEPDRTDRARRLRYRPRSQRAGARGADLVEAAPRLALAAPPDPLGRGPAALAAPVGQGRLRHGRHRTGVHRHQDRLASACGLRSGARTG